ncbi:transcription intermediary factor 1-alpha-like [Thalassophryne amazonica]|uniref:transcription intermediary factor 1-alpha-like n=1 Tax=Thalassophryne amazonica TaxID=390379 RepID=UPI001470B1DB|nr:transcription intermediary factor 1-alpha-like [Thalassophryne amazonica]
MAKSPHRRHGNFPQRRTRLLSRVVKCGAQCAPEITLSRPDPHPASVKEELNLPAEHLNSSKLKMEPNWSRKRRPRFSSPTEKRQRHPVKDITAALKRIRMAVAKSQIFWENIPGSPQSELHIQSRSPYLVFGSEEWEQDGKNECETFYLDPDAEQTIFIKFDPEPGLDQDRPLKLEDESDTKCEVDTVGEQSEYSCLPALQESFSSDQATEGIESEDFCGVCLNGGDLLCCDRCPKVFHLLCHVPPLSRFPLGDWVCTLCRTDQDPAEPYDCENIHHHGGVKAPYTLSHQDQRRCEKLTLLLLCHAVSSPFHEPVSPLAQNYYQIIKKPIDLSVIRRKLDKSNTLHYFTVDQFVDDVLLMFKNCDTFNYPDSEVAQAGRNLDAFFLNKLKEIFQDQTFPSVSKEKMDRARHRWLNRKKKESYRKKRYIFSGKKYCL